MLTKIKWILLFPLRYIFLMLGYGWREYYSLIINRQDRGISIKDIKDKKHKKHFWALENGNKVKELFIKKGLKKSDDFLDYGCGYGRMELPLIKYLDKNKYIGMDLSKERIRLANEFIASLNTKVIKKHRFFVSVNKTIKDLVGEIKFDKILMYSVISHNPLKEVHKILFELKKHLKKKGKIFFDYQSSHENIPNDYFISFMGFTLKRSVKDFRFSNKDISNVMDGLGLKYKELKEFEKFQDSITSNHYKKLVMVQFKD